jgi:hypothetical protein
MTVTPAIQAPLRCAAPVVRSATNSCRDPVLFIFSAHHDLDCVSRCLGFEGQH